MVLDRTELRMTQLQQLSHGHRGASANASVAGNLCGVWRVRSHARKRRVRVVAASSIGSPYTKCMQ